MLTKVKHRIGGGANSRRLVQDRKPKLKLVDFPLPAEGFAVGMVWHERSHAHPAQRWIRELIAGLKW